MTPYRVLIVDDTESVARTIATVARSSGFEVELTLSAAEFQVRYVLFKPDIVVLDLAMPETDGIELLRFLEKAQSQARLIIVSGFDDNVLEGASRLGAARGLKVAGSLRKPIRAAALRELLAAAQRDMEEAKGNARTDRAG